jgi:PAS domain S-box-containing protein
MTDWVSHLDWTIKTAAIVAACIAIAAAFRKLKKHADKAITRAGHILNVPSGMVSAIGEKPGDIISQSLKALVKSSALRRIEVQLIQEKLQMGFYLCSPEGHCIETNPYLDNLFGLTSSEMAGYGWLSVVVDHQKHHVAQEWNASISLGLPYRARYQIENPRTKQRVWVKTSAFVIKESGGLPSGYAGFLHADEDQKSEVFTAEYMTDLPHKPPTNTSRIKKQFTPSESLRICYQ